ncbi:MAG: 2-C-methyl-D-erythritol 4-phosphate cytidylyltransferase [Chlamydiales bacterium]|nr:2-C-methyl-D-erythritol 4-phosphate cytidylyltransferase [Chlamydiales bacterium]MCH9635943.1 2-C-methyl-D-erythritol 4-phosphate cytidylyltransferase [Chlamydiales bacterium]MCH9704467.1 2-C-methyl-D-erythritol 4-phosphate cytidylyltransferase [Chlamydiota bacterium]
MDDLAVVFLAGGVGKRFGSTTPKQFQPFEGKPLALQSFEVLNPLDLETVVVVDKSYEELFDGAIFATPGARRQDSVANGIAKTNKEWIMVHDSARPNITLEMVHRLYEAAKKCGAATTGMPMTATVKQVCDKGLVEKTLDRDRIWEIQTPQIVKRDVLLEGLALDQEVTDDVSLAELVGCPVTIVEGSFRNIKVTKREDLELARRLREI